MQTPWHVEAVEPLPLWANGLDFGSFRLIQEGCSPLHSWRLYETSRWGIALEINGDLQSAEIDQAHYHSTLVSPALDRISGLLQDVLVLGAGPGGSLPPLLTSNPNARVTLTDVDPLMIRMLRPHMQAWHRQLYRARQVQELWGDAATLLPSLEPEKYDLVVIDLCDPRFDPAAAPLLTEHFWRNVARVMRPHGILAAQVGDPEDHVVRVQFMSAMASTFDTAPYQCEFLSFGSSWCFATGRPKENLTTHSSQPT